MQLVSNCYVLQYITENLSYKKALKQSGIRKKNVWINTLN